jgi:hypothetical protein
MTTTMNAQKTVNAMRWVNSRLGKDGKQYRIEITLDDKCQNGHADFHITGQIWHAKKPKIDKYIVCQWAIGDYISEEFPEFKIFDRLHGCDVKGAPTYAVANGFYNIKNGFNSKSTGEAFKIEYCEYYRIAPKQFDILSTAEDKAHFKYLLYKLDIPAQWEKEAKEAIAILEDLTGTNFVDASIKYQLEPMLAEEEQAMAAKIKAGYYTPEALKERADAKALAQAAKLRADVIADCDKSILKAAQERDAKLLVLDAGLPIDNFIFYNHTKTGTFNWQDSSYRSKVTPEQFAAFLDLVNDKTPDGISWELK